MNVYTWIHRAVKLTCIWNRKCLKVPGAVVFMAVSGQPEGRRLSSAATRAGALGGWANNAL